MTRRWLRVVVAGACGCIVAGLAGAQGAYRWVDDNGKVHYSDAPPAAKDAKRLKADAPPGTIAPPKLPVRPPQDVTDSRASSGRGRKANVADCLQARRNLDTLKRERPVYRIDKNGERIYLEDDQRRREIDRMQRVAAECR